MNDTPIALSTKHCLICKGGRKNECLHWHESDNSGLPWVYCVGKCQRAYSIYEYTATAGISLGDFLKLKFDIKEAPPNEVRKMEWPASFIPLFDKRAKSGIEYLASRGIEPDDGMYYDTWRNAIVFPYYYDKVFVGAQMRLIEPRIDEDGKVQKIETIPGTRLGLLFFNYDGVFLPPQVKGIIVTEGALNAFSIQQALNSVYGGFVNNPWKCIAASGSGASKYQVDSMKELKEQGYKVIIASDADDAGVNMFEKFSKADAITHYAFTEDPKQDWNDFLLCLGKVEFASFFLKRVHSVKSS